MLVVDGLEVGYGDLQVVWGISFEVPEDSIVAILGPNGAGKTTTLRTISGLLKLLYPSPEAAIPEKAFMIPQTVPNRPMNAGISAIAGNPPCAALLRNNFSPMTSACH